MIIAFKGRGAGRSVYVPDELPRWGMEFCRHLYRGMTQHFDKEASALVVLKNFNLKNNEDVVGLREHTYKMLYTEYLMGINGGER